MDGTNASKETIGLILGCLKDVVCIILIFAPYVYVLCTGFLFLARCVMNVLIEFSNTVKRMLNRLRYLFRAKKHPTDTYSLAVPIKLSSRCFSLFYRGMNPSQREVYRLSLLRNLFVENALNGHQQYVDGLYLVCDPATKEENLSRALLYFVYGKLVSEARSPSPLNLFAECPDLANVPGLETFQRTFKDIKDFVVKEILPNNLRVEGLSDLDYNIMIEFIKLIMIKKAHENVQDFRNAIGKKQLDNLINEMYVKSFIPSSSDMIKLISRSFSIEISILKPGCKAAHQYTSFEILNCNAISRSSRAQGKMNLLEQGENSYTLIS